MPEFGDYRQSHSFVWCSYIISAGTRWRLANTINGQRVEAAVVCFENIEATISVAGDEDAAVIVAFVIHDPLLLSNGYLSLTPPPLLL